MKSMRSLGVVLRRGVLIGAMSLLGSVTLAQEVNLYTTREPGLVRPLLDAFTRSTGVKVNTVFVRDGLAERVASEGARSPADVLMTVDFGNLVDLVEKGLTQPVKSSALEAAIPAHLRGRDGHWFALSLRGRLAYASKDLDLSGLTYEDLANPKWRGKICIRSGQHPYNTALVAAMIARKGEAQTREWLRGVKSNLARRPGGGDRDVARDIMGGLCQIGLGNSYYIGLMRSGKSGPEQRKWGESIQVVLPTFAGGGTHVNVSGAAVARHAPNQAAAVRLLEYLVSPEAQAIYARANYEYPVRAGAATDPIIAALGALKPDTTPLGEIARNRETASKLIDEVGFDN